MSILALFEGLTRAAPGDAAAVEWAVAIAGTPPGARVLEAGCGLGADLPALKAAVQGAQIVALDMAAPFIARVRADHPDITALVADMAAPPMPPYDLIWCGGAIYNLGVSAGLAAFRAALAPGGRVAFSDLVWRVADPSPEARAFWAAEGLTLRDQAGLLAVVAQAGFHVLGQGFLPASAWAAYYDPLAARLNSLQPADADMAEVMAGFRGEIALWRGQGGDYGYLLIVAEPR